MTGGWLAFALALSAGPGPEAGVHDVVVQTREVGLGMVMDLSRLPPMARARAARLPVAVFHGSQERMRVSARRIVERARGQMPILAMWLPPDHSGPKDDQYITIGFRRPTPGGEAPAPMAGCSRAVTDIRAGAIPVADDFAAAPCAGVASDRPLRYDRGMRAARALRDIRAGESLSTIPPPMLARVQPGQRLYVSAASGPVMVDREVQAVQASASGRPLFVRAGDGAIFSVPSPEMSP